jgi:small subunit ribosomal protein S1
MSRNETNVPLPVWQDVVARNSGGGVLDGLVTRVLPFGAFVEVEQGLHGLLPQSAWSAPPELGSSMSVRIDKFDVENRRMSLIPA